MKNASLERGIFYLPPLRKEVFYWTQNRSDRSDPESLEVIFSSINIKLRALKTQYKSKAGDTSLYLKHSIIRLKIQTHYITAKGTSCIDFLADHYQLWESELLGTLRLQPRAWLEARLQIHSSSSQGPATATVAQPR